MSNSVIYHLLKASAKLDCNINYSHPEFGVTVCYMINNATDNGNAHCPCDASGKIFCPCKDWVQKCKKGTAKKGDKCHCEIFEKV